MTLLLKIFFFYFIQRHSVERGKKQKFRGGSLELGELYAIGCNREEADREGFCEQKDSKRNLRVQLENGWLRTDMKKFWMLAYGVRVYFAGDREKSLKVF